MNLHGEYFFFVALLWLGLVVAEHKHVSARAVTVEVTEEKYIAALQGALHHQLGVVVDRVEFAGAADPLSVQVLTH